MKAKPLINYIVEDGKFKDDMFVNVTICNVPESLLRVYANSCEAILSKRSKRRNPRLNEEGSSEEYVESCL